MEKFKWAYLGAGHIARTTAKELRAGTANEIVAVWNRTFAKAEEFAREYGGTAYETPEAAINALDVEGVYIAVNADRHADLMKLCIDLGRPGEITEVKASFVRPLIHYAKMPRLTTNEMIGGALMDTGVYAVAYAYRLFGMPEQIALYGSPPVS